MLDRFSAAAAAMVSLILISAPAPAGAASMMERSPGERAFVQHCAKCHGEAGSGTDKGPPLVHKVYEPGHHGDFSFRMAVRNGVRAHHWRFGNMPKLPDVTPEEVEAIIKYVRGLQEKAGIF